MKKKLSDMTTTELKAEMSIAGDPNKLMWIMSDMLTAMGRVDRTNPAEVINMKLVLCCLQAEVREWKKEYEDTIGQQIS